jgi:uncharacterized protein involved in outer membrane biogenesis
LRRLLKKVVLGLLALLLLLGMGGYLLVRHILSPDQIRPVAEAKLSAALGKPVKLGEMSIRVFPVPALQAKGIRVGEDQAPALAIASLRIVPSLPAALRGSLVVDRVDLDGLDLALRRTKKGDWLLPYDPPKTEGTGQPSGDASKPILIRAIRIQNGAFRVVDDVPAAGGPSREVAALRDIEGTLSMDAQDVRVESLSARFEKTVLKGTAAITPEATTLDLASPSIASEDLPQIFAFLGAAPIEGLSIKGAAPFHLKMTIPQKGSLTASGEFDAASLKLGTMEVTALKTPFKLDNDTVVLSPLTFTAYDGKQKGNVTLALARNPMGYSVQTSLEGLDVNKALSANTSAKEVLMGTGQVQASVKGSGFDEGALKTRLNGNVEVALRKGVIKNLPLLAKINQALKITGGNDKDTHFESLDGTFAIGSGKAHTENLHLKAGELFFLAKGDVLFDQTLAFKGTARFSKAKSAEILHSLSDLEYLANDQGEVEIPLTVSGPASSPSVGVDLGSIARKAFKQQIQKSLGKELKKLFGK